MNRHVPQTRSEAVTRGIRVEVQSQYLPEQSAPPQARYVFAYTIRISNESSRPAQLQSRHWIITNGEGAVEEVRGPGVVGEQPLLDPGEAFEYTSGAVLTTARGTMRGTYLFVGADGEPFEVTIAEFSLELPYSLN